MNSVQYRRVFFGSGAKGDTAAVFQLDHALSDAELLNIAQNTPAGVSCFVTRHDHKSWQIRIFDPVREIQFCGHGLLASADVLLHLEPILTVTIETPHHVVCVEKQDGKVWLGVEKPKLLVASQSDAGFERLPALVNVTKSLEENGYWVAELAMNTHLEDMTTADLSALSLGKRALIVTERGPSPEFDYRFRYFAPQYGVAEGPASGSANAVLLSYWENRLFRTKYDAIQLSPERAVHQGRVDEAMVWISGNIQPFTPHFERKEISC